MTKPYSQVYKRYHFSTDEGQTLFCFTDRAGRHVEYTTDPFKVTCMSCRKEPAFKLIKDRAMLSVLPLPHVRELMAIQLANAEPASVIERHVLLSLFEYLKDAERWRYVRENSIVPGAAEFSTPQEFTQWVDDKISEENKNVAPPPAAAR